MGEVYKARDVRLDRTVAIKVLHEHLADNPDRRMRFEYEARAISKLNHPHICTSHDVGHDKGVDYLVVEYLDGQTLADRLQKGALPMEQALQIAIQIASALSAAHRVGVIHRDLKPANVMLTKNGAKLLDFGIARMTAASATGTSATLPGTLTADGTLLGTVQYMSPEQLEGREADSRSDLFALAAVVYEMVTGRRAFDGESQASVMAAILEREPPPASTLQPRLPPLLDQIITQCLAKDPNERWQSAHDVRAALIGIDASQSADTARTSVPVRRAVAAVAIACLIVGGLLGRLLLGTSARDRLSPTHLSMSVAPSEQLGPHTARETRPSRSSFALTPDGRTIVFSGTTGATTQLFIRSLDHAGASPMAGTQGAAGPFMSPDGQWVAYWADGKLKKIALAGGPSIDICDTEMGVPLQGGVGGPYGADWGTNDLIVFSRGRDIATVAASGGTPRVIASTGAQLPNVMIMTTPRWLPGARAILFTTRPSDDWTQAQIVMQSAEGGEPRPLLSDAADARYVPTGHLVYMRLGTLMAVPFDGGRLRVTGVPFPIIEGVMQAVNMEFGPNETGAGQYAVAGNGTLAYVGGGIHPDPTRQLVWVNRHGVESPLREPPGPILQPRISPDGQHLVYFVQRAGTRESDVWTYDMTRDAATRLTFSGDNNQPIWAPDGRHVIFGSNAGGLFWLATEGGTSREQLNPGLMAASSALPNNLVAVTDYRPGRPFRISILSLNGDRTLKPFLESSFAMTHPAFSADGRWLAYVSPESGQNEVYVQAYPGPGDKHRISTDGGTGPTWARSGRELFYHVFAQRDASVTAIMAVDIDTTHGFTAGRPRRLFAGPYVRTTPTRGYDVSPDSQRFIMVKPVGEPETPPRTIEIVLNWTSALIK
jgi:serine/threonine-protein kinase